MPEAVLWLNFIFLSLILVTAVAAVFMRDLIGAVFLIAAMGFFVAVLWALLNALDVSFTEAMVGTGASTIFFFLALFRTTHTAKNPAFSYHPAAACLFILAVAAFWLWGSLDLPLFSSADSPPNAFLSPHYLANAQTDMHTPNAVTAVLADYRSFDTLIEATVIFTAGIACMLIMGSSDD